jgi:hypothetical protein
MLEFEPRAMQPAVRGQRQVARGARVKRLRHLYVGRIIVIVERITRLSARGAPAEVT